jgi:hypothetical protein
MRPQMSFLVNKMRWLREEVPIKNWSFKMLSSSRMSTHVRRGPPEAIHVQRETIPMKPFDPKQQLDLASLRPGTPMFSDVIRRLQEATDLSQSRVRDMISGLRRVARALGRTPEDTPADPKWLQARLAKVAAASLNPTRKSWQNAVSDARAALTSYGIAKAPSSRRRRMSELSADWRQLWEAILASGDLSLRTSLCRFVHFLNDRGVRPADVTDEDATAYLEALEAGAILKSPYLTWRAAVTGWNLACDRLPS